MTSDSRSPGSSPGGVGAAPKGSLEESTGVGFPQAHSSSLNADYGGHVREQFFEDWYRRLERACSDARLMAGCPLSPDEYAEVCARTMVEWFFRVSPNDSLQAP